MTAPVPIVHEGEPRRLKGLVVSFVAVVRQVDPPDGAITSASVHALFERLAVGSIKWDPKRDGEIQSISVHPDYRRKGVATGLFEVSKELAAQNDWVPPQHSPKRTQEGDAWAQSLGADPAETIETWSTGLS